MANDCSTVLIYLPNIFATCGTEIYGPLFSNYMFGNGLVRIKPNPYALKPATYTVEYEKKLSVLNPVRPANIDVYLASDDELMLFMRHGIMPHVWLQRI